MDLLQSSLSQRNVSIQLHIIRFAGQRVYHRFQETWGYVRRLLGLMISSNNRRTGSLYNYDQFVKSSPNFSSIWTYQIEEKLRDFHGVPVNAYIVSRRLAERGQRPLKPAYSAKLERIHPMSRQELRIHAGRKGKGVRCFSDETESCLTVMMEIESSTKGREILLCSFMWWTVCRDNPVTGKTALEFHVWTSNAITT